MASKVVHHDQMIDWFEKFGLMKCKDQIIEAGLDEYGLIKTLPSIFSICPKMVQWVNHEDI